MANFVSNTLIVKGTKKQVNYFLSKGGFHEINDFNNADEVSRVFEDASLSSWLPMPQTFKDYDTTNPMMSEDTWNNNEMRRLHGGEFQYKEHNTYEEYVRGYKEAAAEQKTYYGVVGWYSYNIKTLGTKWDAPMEINTEETFEDEDNVTLYFDFDTAWSMPMAWFEFLCRKFYDLRFFIYGSEESGVLFQYFSNVTGNLDDVYLCFGQLKLQGYYTMNDDFIQGNIEKANVFKEKFLDFAQDN